MFANDDLGWFEREDDHIDVRFERHYRRPVETVWSAITDPVRLADWMGVSHVEQRVGGRIELMADGPHPMTGEIRVWDPPHVLEFTWSNTHAPDSVIRYELAPEGSGTRLSFLHRHMPYVNSGLMLPGWHTYLAALGALLESASGLGPGAWRRMQAVYVDRYRLDGVALDP